jgi:hypothetical protein
MGSTRKKPYRKKIVSHLSACDVTRVVSLGTNNLRVRVCESGELSYCIFTIVTHYLDLLKTVLLSGYSSYLFDFHIEP